MNLLAPLADKVNALECLAGSDAVYSVANLENEDCHLFIKEFDEYVRVDVRGSKSAEDWINDLDFEFVDTIYGKVHGGFWRSTAPMFPQVKARLKPMQKPIVVDGHSLGGAQATLLALELAIESFPIAWVPTFGCPRVGGAEFKALYDHWLGAKTIRYVNGRDVVPRLAFSDLGFLHVGQEAFLSSAGGLQMNPTLYELIHDDVVGIVGDIRAGKVELLEDHHLPRYQARIEAVQTSAGLQPA